MKYFSVSFSIILFFICYTNQEPLFLRFLQILSSLKSPNTIDSNTSLVSTNGFWKMNLQSDGNLVLKDKNDILFWSSFSSGKGIPPYSLNLQDDGNLVIYDSKNTAIWSSNTNKKGVGPYNLVLQGDGNLVLYTSNGIPLFASNTNFAPVFPGTGCVWLYSECNFRGQRKEYCSDFATLDSTTSSILTAEASINCSSESNCFTLPGYQKFNNFKLFDNPQNSKLTINFEGYGNDFYVGFFPSDQTTSFIYAIIYGGWGNSMTKVYKQDFNDNNIICNYQLGVRNTVEKSSYKLVVDKSLGTISMFLSNEEVFNCKITGMNVSDLKYYAFASFNTGLKICIPNSSNSSNCSPNSNVSVSVYSKQNYSGEESLKISNPIVCLKSLNFDKKIASIKFLNKNCSSKQYLNNGQCMECPIKCTKCDGPNKCTECESSLTVNQNTGLCGISCPPGQYELNGSCTNCSTNCATCTSYNKCSSCINSQRINSLQMCEPDCPPVKYAFKGNCVDCPSPCLTCLNEEMCTSCFGNAILSPQYKCEQTCGINEFRNTSGTCSKCPSTCNSCADYESCTNCIAGFINYKGICLGECPLGTIKVKGNCYAVVNCPNGWFQDFNNSGDCSQCGDNCLKCVSKTSCYQCDGNYNLIGFDSSSTTYYEVSAEASVGLDGPSISYGIKDGKQNISTIKIGSSSCTTQDQIKLLSSIGDKSSANNNIIAIIISIVGFSAFSITLFVLYKKKKLCWKEDTNNKESEKKTPESKPLETQIHNIKKSEYSKPDEAAPNRLY